MGKEVGNKILWNAPKFGKKEVELVTEVLESGYVSEGPKTKELEEKLSKIVKAKHIIMATSATAALYLAIEADKRIKSYTEGDVIIPAMTMVATKNAVELANLSLDVRDVDHQDFLLKENFDLPNARIVIPVNLMGRGFVRETMEGSETIICDNAGCLGSNVPNGKVGCYSLQANKLINCGQGGFCATDDDEYAKMIRQIKDFGRENKYQNNTIGFNFKFNDIQAAVVLGQLEQLEDRKNLHLQQYWRYEKELSSYGGFIEFGDGEIPLWIEFLTYQRDELYDYLLENGIECRKPWESLSKDCPNAVYYEENCLWLPNGAGLTPKQQERVIKLIKEFYERN